MGAVAQGVDDVVLDVRDGEHDDLDVHHLLADEPDGLDAVHDRHLDVEDDEVGTQGPGLLDPHEAVLGLADDLHVRLVGEQGRDRATEERLVVDEQDPGRLASSGRSSC